MPRPFYGSFAWAFNLIIDRPVQKDCDAIVGWLVERGVFPGSALLDAGCGTGRYAAELDRRGYAVNGIDTSPQLIAEAKRLLPQASGSISFGIWNLRKPLPRAYDAVLCRGVLNDFIDDESRRSALRAFAEDLRPGGVLIFDVREWEASVARKTAEPLFRKRVTTERGVLLFESITVLDPEHHQLEISERHVLTHEDGSEEAATNLFRMQCWTRGEIAQWTRQAGFTNTVTFGAYDPSVPVAATDRLVVITQRA